MVELAKKRETLAFLKKKAERINLKKEALNKYEQFLEDMKKHSDEFPEVSDIIFRYDTLIKENANQEANYQKLDERLKTMKDNTTKYIKEKSTEKLRLNNDIGNKQIELEEIIDKQNKLKTQAEETSNDKLSKQSELAQALMAIENIE